MGKDTHVIVVNFSLKSMCHLDKTKYHYMDQATISSHSSAWLCTYPSRPSIHDSGTIMTDT